jgi:hypothetical protein
MLKAEKNTSAPTTSQDYIDLIVGTLIQGTLE